jgi:hypothetical protein
VERGVVFVLPPRPFDDQRVPGYLQDRTRMRAGPICRIDDARSEPVPAVQRRSNGLARLARGGSGFRLAGPQPLILFPEHVLVGLRAGKARPGLIALVVRALCAHAGCDAGPLVNGAGLVEPAARASPGEVLLWHAQDATRPSEAWRTPSGHGAVPGQPCASQGFRRWPGACNVIPVRTGEFLRLEWR